MVNGYLLVTLHIKRNGINHGRPNFLWQRGPHMSLWAGCGPHNTTLQAAVWRPMGKIIKFGIFRQNFVRGTQARINVALNEFKNVIRKKMCR
jgi:hypothetical protein